MNSQRKTSDSENQIAIIVLGMHRSGTSLVTQLIAKTGIYLGDNLYGPDKHNEDGYWENIELNKLNNKILQKLGGSWDRPILDNSIDLSKFDLQAKQLIRKMDSNSNIWCWKDPRMSILFEYWRKHLYNHKLLFILPFRNPTSVVESLKKRNNFNEDFSLSLWEYYNRTAVASMSKSEAFCFISYDNLINSPKKECEKLLDFLTFNTNKNNNNGLKKMVESIKLPLNHGSKNDISKLSKDQEFLYKSLMSGDLDSIKKTNINNQWYLKTILSNINKENEDKKNLINVYFSNVEYDFSIKRCLTQEIKNGEKYIFEIENEEIRYLRIDPINLIPCAIEILSISIYDADQNPISFTIHNHNALYNKENFYLFIGVEGQIYLRSESNKSIKKIEINFSYKLEHNEITMLFNEKIKQVDFLKVNPIELNYNRKQINKINKTTDKLQNENEDILNYHNSLINNIDDSITSYFKQNTLIQNQNKKISKENIQLQQEINLKDERLKKVEQNNIFIKQSLKEQSLLVKSLNEEITKFKCRLEKNKLDLTQINEKFDAAQKQNRDYESINLILKEQLRIADEKYLNLTKTTSGLLQLTDRQSTTISDLYDKKEKIQTQLNVINDELRKKSLMISKLISRIEVLIKKNENDNKELEILKNTPSHKLHIFITSIIISLSQFRFKLRNFRDYKIIEKSILFDSTYYLANNKDIIRNIDPVIHYLLHGGIEGRNPSNKFDSSKYLEFNKDVAEAKINPLLHYLKFGENEGRETYVVNIEKKDIEIETNKKPKHESIHLIEESETIEKNELSLIRNSDFFNEKYYRNKYPDLEHLTIDLAEHYYLHGFNESRNPSKKFNTDYYLKMYPDVKDLNVNPLVHYLKEGQHKGYHPRYLANLKKFKLEKGSILYQEKTKNRYNYKPSDVKLIAFYLPQFHPFKENDEWWGEGFTDWTNVTKAKAQYKQHYQPQLPSSMGFYDLRLTEPLKKQAGLAKEFGIYGFCFHHYYFDGKRLMETPVNNLLENQDIDLPFCLCWANENWTRRWDGQENDILIAQNHTPEDDIRFIKDIEKYFLDPRYITIDNRPLFVLYKVNQLPEPEKTLQCWRNLWKEKHGNDLFIVMAQTFGETDPNKYGFDAAVEFPPHNIASEEITDSIEVNDNFKGKVYSFNDFAKKSLANDNRNFDLFKTVFPSWDNTARRNENATIFEDGTPDDYKSWLKACMVQAKWKLTPNKRFVFINAWNEWAEGAHLEPCQKYGYSYLNKTKEALIEIQKNQTDAYSPLVSVIVPNYNHEIYLEKRLESIYNQTYKNFEVILLDDSSTDNSREILTKYAKKHNHITKTLFNKDNSNKVFTQWAKGIKASNGELIWIAESDDYCDINFIETLIEYFKNESIQLAYSDVEFIDENENIISNGGFKDYVKNISSEKWENSYVETAANEVKTALGIQNTIPNASGVIFRKPPKDFKLLADKDWRKMKVAGDWLFYLNILIGGKIAFNINTKNYFRRHIGSASEVTYKKDVFYKEVGIVGQYIAEHFRISDNLIQRSRENFEKLYTLQIGTNKEDFKKWYNYDKILKKAINRKPNIMISIYGFYPGGAEIMPIRLANELKKMGCSVLVHSCKACKTNLEIKNLLRTDIPLIETYDINEIKTLIKDHNIDLINSHHWHFQLLHQFDENILGSNCKHYATLHGIIETNSKDYIISDEAILKVDKSIHKWIYTADKNISRFSNFNIEESKFIKIPNGVGKTEYERVKRSELNIPKNAFVLCTVSRAIKEKGWTKSIAVVEKLRNNSKKDIHIIFVGDGPIYDQLKESHKKSYIHFVGFDKRSIGFYSISDLGIMLTTFKSESFPLTIIDCLYAGKPYVSTDIGEIKTILSHNNNMAGAVFDVNNGNINIEEVVDFIKKIIQDDIYYSKLCEVAKLKAKEYSIENIALKYNNLFENEHNSNGQNE